MEALGDDGGNQSSGRQQLQVRLGLTPKAAVRKISAGGSREIFIRRNGEEGAGRADVEASPRIQKQKSQLRNQQNMLLQTMQQQRRGQIDRRAQDLAKLCGKASPPLELIASQSAPVDDAKSRPFSAGGSSMDVVLPLVMHTR